MSVPPEVDFRYGTGATGTARSARFGMWIVVGTAACYITLWLMVWLPVYLLGESITLFFYPIWILAWFVLALAMATGLVVCGVALAKKPRRRMRRGLVVTVVLASIFLITSLPVLWWGSALLPLFGITDINLL